MADFVRRGGVKNRILAVSDIHGHPELFLRLLERAGFSDDDLLVIVGDIIEKGPDSLGALRAVMELSKRGNVIALAGNVDAAILSRIRGLSPENADAVFEYLGVVRSWNQSVIDEMTRELGFTAESASELLNAKDELLRRFEPELDFIASLPTVFETDDYVFVHGGLRDTDIAANEIRDAFELLKYDNFFAVAPAFPKYIVTGHYPVALFDDKIADCSPKIDRGRKLITIDGGCGIKEFGQLNLLMIPGGDADISEVSYISADDLRVVTALDRQKGSEDPLNIRWIDNDIETLEKFDGFRKIRHLSSGRECLIPDSYVYDDSHSMDYPYNYLEVAPGERLSFVCETTLGYLVKKGSVVGLYKGRKIES